MLITVVSATMTMQRALAEPNYVEFWGATQGKIAGSVTQKGKEGSTTLRRFSLNADKPSGPGSLVLAYEIGKESIALANAASTHEVLQQVLMHLWRPAIIFGSGVASDINYATLRFSNARITHVALMYDYLASVSLGHHIELQELTLSYEGVEMTWNVGNLTTTDGVMGPPLGSAIPPAPPPPPPPPAPPGITPLPTGTLRATVAKDQVNRYSAAVSAGTYVVSLTGIIGAAKLDVYSDAGFTQPVTCLVPANLANSTYAQPADCSFVATGGTVYVSVTGTSYLATVSNRYDILVTPRHEAAPTSEGTLASPVVIAVNMPYGGTVGAGRDDASYYLVNTTGRGDLAISLTGQKADQYLDLFIYDNSDFSGIWLGGTNCHTGEQLHAPESCVLPAGKPYYVKVMNRDYVGGPFTLTAYSPLQAATPPAAAPALSPGALQQAIPASSTAP
jgi:hypothetical protein